MPHITTGDGTRIFYQFDGEEGLPVLLLSNSLGTTLEMWDPQMAALTGHYRVLRYDSRGHGRSDAPEGPSVAAAQTSLSTALAASEAS